MINWRGWLSWYWDAIVAIASASWTKAIELWSAFWDWSVPFYQRNETLVDAAIVGAILIAILLVLYRQARNLIRRRRAAKQERAKRMTRKERVQYLRDLFGYKVSELIDEMVDKGEIKEGEGRAYRRRFAQVVNLKGLIPQKATALSPSEKASLTEALAIMTGKRHSPKIPGPKPGEKCEPLTPQPAKASNVVNISSAPRTSFGAKFKRAKKA